MATNVYFNPKVRTEQNMYEDIVIESIRMYGQDVYYLPRDVVNRDYIMGEDIESQFDDAYMVEMYIENTEGFEGEGNIFAKFGMEIRDECTFVVARRSWEKLVGRWNNTVGNFRPNEGDLIYLPLSNSFFEISFVEHEQPFYQLNNLPMYKLQARMFEFSGEDFNTNIAEIDQIETVHAYQLGMRIINFTGSVDLGDRLYQIFERDLAGNPTKYISGELVSQSQPSVVERELYLADFETSDSSLMVFSADPAYPLVNNVDPSLVTYQAEIVEFYEPNGDDETFTNDPSAFNEMFEETADGIIDFSEINPFGDPS